MSAETKQDWKALGNAAFGRKAYREAAILYTRALLDIMNVTTGRTVTEAVAVTQVLFRNRSKAYFHLGYHHLAYSDISHVARVPEPGHTATQQQATDLLHLGLVFGKLGSHQAAARVFMTLAQSTEEEAKRKHWLDKALQCQQDAARKAEKKDSSHPPKTLNVLHSLTSSQAASLASQLETRSFACYAPIVPFVLDDLRCGETRAPLVMDSESQKLMERAGVEVKASTIAGLGLFARRRFRAGEIILEEEPMLFATVDEDHCFFCARPLPLSQPQDDTQHSTDHDKQDIKASSKKKRKVESDGITVNTHRVPCHQCACEVYCSPECRDRAWATYHRALCGMDYSAMRERVRRTGATFSSRSLVLFVRAAGFLMCHPSYPTIVTAVPDYFMQRWMTCLRDRPADGAFKLSFEQLTDRLDELQKLFATVARPLNPISFDLHFFDVMMQMMVAYSHGICSATENKENRVGFGVGCYRLASLLNHSCVPNCNYDFNVERTGNRIVLCANDDIEPGQELTCTYIPIRPDRDQRQHSLMQYHFECQCILCEAQRLHPFNASCGCSLCRGLKSG